LEKVGGCLGTHKLLNIRGLCRAGKHDFLPYLLVLFIKMAGLFGSTPANTANTLGDLSKDIQLNQGPGDSISDLSFSPQSEHLAVSSWDKKVRIYEVNESGGEGKALFEHEGPVLSCDWSKVRSLFSDSTGEVKLIVNRMAQRWSVEEQTKLPACSI
jgi:WD40 repeat protein